MKNKIQFLDLLLIDIMSPNVNNDGIVLSNTSTIKLDVDGSLIYNVSHHIIPHNNLDFNMTIIQNNKVFTKLFVNILLFLALVVISFLVSVSKIFLIEL